jgi:GDP-mannose 6-dehydrogenase
MDLVPEDHRQRIGLNGLAFKAGTDDLRESPIVIIAEHLIGKGYDLKIHDAGLETSRITGANRDYIEKRIPHLSSRLVSNLDELIEHSDILLITRDGDGLMERAAQLGKRPTIIDLRGRVPQSKKVLSLSGAPSRGRGSSGPPARTSSPASGAFKRPRNGNGKAMTVR